MTITMGPLADTIYRQKYSLNGEEEWVDTARRVVTSVMGPYLPHLVEPVIDAVVNRKFMPGGRYLYASGKPFAQTQNCSTLR